MFFLKYVFWGRWTQICIQLFGTRLVYQVMSTFSNELSVKKYVFLKMFTHICCILRESTSYLFIIIKMALGKIKILIHIFVDTAENKVIIENKVIKLSLNPWLIIPVANYSGSNSTFILLFYPIYDGFADLLGFL